MERVALEAAAATLAALPAAPDEAVQLDMLGFAPVDVLDGGDGYAAAVTRWERGGRKGRKPGALNRRSADLAEYLLQFGPHPLVGMMVMQARPAKLLASELGCKAIEAAELQHKCRAELAPFFEGKKPVAIEFQGQAAMFIMPGMPGLDGQLPAFAPLPGSAAPIAAMPDVSFVENQPLGNAPAGASE